MSGRKIRKWICFLLWMIVIFLFSQQSYSGDKTYSVIEKVLPFFHDENGLNTINFIIRKSAHFIEYFILAYFLYSLLREYKIRIWYGYVISIIFCFLFACFDEIHQSFVSGRSALFKDCLLDTCGSMFFVLLCILYYPKKK